MSVCASTNNNDDDDDDDDDDDERRRRQRQQRQVELYANLEDVGDVLVFLLRLRLRLLCATSRPVA